MRWRLKPREIVAEISETQIRENLQRLAKHGWSPELDRQLDLLWKIMEPCERVAADERADEPIAYG